MWHVVQNVLLYTAIFLFSGLTLLYLYYKHAFTYWSSLRVPHLKPSFPLGNIDTHFSKQSAQFLNRIYFDMKKKGHAFCGYYMFAMPIFLPINPKVIHHFLAVNFNSFHDRGVYVDEENDPVGWNLVTMTGEKWKRMRELVSPTWTAGKVKMMFPLMHKCKADLEVIMNELVNNEEPINILEVAKRLTVDVICACALGIEGNCLKDPNSEILHHGKLIFNEGFVENFRISTGLTAPQLAKFLKMSAFNPIATKFFRKLVHELVDYREKHNIEKEDLLNLLIRLKHNKSIKDGEENSNKTNKGSSMNLTVDQITAQCFIFFLGGFETTASVLQFALYEMGLNHTVQDRARQEVKDVLKKYDNKICYEAVKEMRYLENLYHETLRKYPSVLMLNRICTEDFTIPDTNITIEKGTKAILPILSVHMDPEYYPDPERFDPDRFTDEAKAARNPYIYLPFGGGPRICPGLRFGTVEAKLAFAFLLQRYKFNVHPSTGKIKLIGVGNVLAPEDPIMLSVEHLKEPLI